VVLWKSRNNMKLQWILTILVVVDLRCKTY
jgi:hypothetical protein